MNVRDGMTNVVLTVGPAHTLREASRQMSARRVGAAVVIDPEHAGMGILTERDLLDSVGAGQDPDTELVADHRTDDVVFASPAWTLEQAAAAMVRGNFRHLVVIEDDEVIGLLSMRDKLSVRVLACADGVQDVTLGEDADPGVLGISHDGRADMARRHLAGGLA